MQPGALASVAADLPGPAQTDQATVSAGQAHRFLSANSTEPIPTPFPHPGSSQTCQGHLGWGRECLETHFCTPPLPYLRQGLLPQMCHLQAPEVSAGRGNGPHRGSWLGFRLCWIGPSRKPQEETTSPPTSASSGTDSDPQGPGD